MSTEVVTSKRSVRGATSASKHLENEARAFLQSGPALFHRAASYSPTLEELQSKSFTDYVRQTLLGVTEPKYFENEGSESARANNHSVGKVIELKDILGRVDMVKLNEGIAKVTLPEGWWDERGIGKDRTARGPEVCTPRPTIHLFDSICSQPAETGRYSSSTLNFRFSFYVLYFLVEW